MTLHDRSGRAGTLPRHRSAARHRLAHPAPSVLSIGPPILAAKITPSILPGWTVPRPRITELIAQGTRWFLNCCPNASGKYSGTCLGFWLIANSIYLIIA